MSPWKLGELCAGACCRPEWERGECSTCVPSRTLAGITPSSPWDSNSYLPPPGMLPAHAWCRSDKFLRDLRQERRLNSCCSALTTRLLGRASFSTLLPFRVRHGSSSVPEGKPKCNTQFCALHSSSAGAPSPGPQPELRARAGCRVPGVPAPSAAKGWFGFYWLSLLGDPFPFTAFETWSSNLASWIPLPKLGV